MKKQEESRSAEISPPAAARPSPPSMHHPKDRLLRDDRLPHIWCPTCGIGTCVSSFVEAIAESGIEERRFAIVSGINAYGRYRNFQTSKEAIIFEPTVNVKSSPDADSQDIFVIHEGTKVKITDKVGNWIEIRIANGSDGWVQENVVEVI